MSIRFIAGLQTGKDFIRFYILYECHKDKYNAFSSSQGNIDRNCHNVKLAFAFRAEHV